MKIIEHINTTQLTWATNQIVNFVKQQNRQPNAKQ